VYNPETELKIPVLKRKGATSYSDEMHDKVHLDKYCLILKFVIVWGACHYS
jgi:hypothetical protein